MRQAIKKTIFAAVTVVGFLIVLEGLCSVFLVFYNAVFWSKRPSADRIHTQHDPELGWVQTPNTRIQNLYGDGRHMTINAQGFRGKHDYQTAVPAGKVRVVCSGDSFTMGYGVDDDQAWVHRLTVEDSRLETINIGMGGYGFDQGYLWYERDGKPFDHDIHLFAFITDDFRRMRSDKFWGYDKPVLRVRDGRLITENVPVPRRAYWVPWLTENREVIEQIRIFQVCGKISKMFYTPKPRRRLSSQEVEDAVRAIIQSLAQTNKQKNSVLVLVYLPTKMDYENRDADTARWRRFLKTESARQGVALIDLYEDFKAMTADQVDALFLKRGEVDFQGAEAHYSAKGNAFVAKRIYQHLLEWPEAAAKIQRASPVDQPDADSPPKGEGSSSIGWKSGQCGGRSNHLPDALSKIEMIGAICSKRFAF